MPQSGLANPDFQEQSSFEYSCPDCSIHAVLLFESCSSARVPTIFPLSSQRPITFSLSLIALGSRLNDDLIEGSWKDTLRATAPLLVTLYDRQKIRWPYFPILLIKIMAIFLFSASFLASKCRNLPFRMLVYWQCYWHFHPFCRQFIFQN